MEDILVGSVDRSIFVFIPDPASTDGSGKTGLVAANLTVSFSRMETDNDATVTDATSSLNDLAALTTAHTDWGVKEVSSTLQPGVYRLDIADAVFASGAWSAIVYVMITSSAAAATPKQFNLVTTTSDLPAAIADAVLDEVLSGHITVGTVGQRLQQIRSGTAQGGAAGSITFDGGASAVDDFYDGVVHITGGSGANQSRGISGYVGATKVASVSPDWAVNPDNTSVFQALPGGSSTITGTVNAQVVGMDANVVTASAIAAGALTAAKFAAGAFDAVWSVAARILTAATNITSTGGTTVPQTGDAFARLGAPVGASTSADIAAVPTTVWAAGTRTLTSSAGVKKNTALSNFHFKMVDSDGVAVTGLTPTCTRLLDGGSFAACANAATEVASGWYRINLATTDLNGDVVTFRATGTGAQPTEITLKTAP